MTDRLTHKACAIVIAVLGIIVYANSLGGAFICDDEHYIQHNPYIRDWSRLPQVFTQSIGAASGRKSDFYRPLVTASFMADYSIWGADPRGYHLTNILLHILAALAVYWLIFALFEDKVLSFLSAALFAAHPVHTEAVAYISGRADPLAAALLLITYFLYIKGRGAAALCYACALLSREGALILPALILLYHYSFKKPVKALKFLPILAVAAAYIVLRTAVLGPALLRTWQAESTALQRIPGFFVAVFNYIKLLILPLGLHMEYGGELFGMANPQAIAGCIMTAALLIYALRMRKRAPFFTFSVLWFFLALLPHSNIYPINAYMAEHWLYLPSIGVFLLLSKGLVTAYNSKRFKAAAAGGAVFLILFYSLLTVRQNYYWRDPLTFYERTYEDAPDNFRVCNNLGNAYFNTGKGEEARRLFEKAIEINPVHPEAYNGLAVYYYSKGQFARAVEYSDKAVMLGYQAHPEFLELLKNYRN